MIRQPIITVLGHVDHGKTSFLDYIRGSTVAAREAGLITQHVGATQVPIDTIQSICKKLDKMLGKLNIPGLLFIDTPGHEAFTNLRKRGGSIADLAVLVIDINQGVQPQTKEAVEILKTFKVPFVVAANKIDVLPGWKTTTTICSDNIKKQTAEVREFFEKKLYQLVGQVSELGFSSNLWTNISNYSKEVAVVPVSAKTGEGMAEILALLAGLSQKFLSNKLEVNETEIGKGTILEMKEEKGMGTTADIILYDGIITSKDYIAVGGVDDVIETSIKAILEPLPLSEIREKGTRFKRVEKVCAAAGIKIIAPDLDKAVAGAPIVFAREKKNLLVAKKELIEEIQKIIIETDQSGIVLKCDTLGSLEAVTGMLKARGIEIKSAGIGNINRGDIMRAKSVAEAEPLKGFVIGFNIKMDDSVEKLAKENKIPVIIDKVVYKLIERFEYELELKYKQIELDKLKGLTWPVKFKILRGCIFRQSNPAIVGVEILAGKLTSRTEIMNGDGKKIGNVKSIERDGEKMDEAKAGDKVAVSISGLTIGRQADEEDELYSNISEADFRILKQKKELLGKAEIETMKHISNIHRKENDLWGM